MSCFAQNYQPKLLASNKCKPFSRLIRETCAHCHGSCLGIRSFGWSSHSHESLDDEFDMKQVILSEMRKRQIKKRSRTSIDSPSSTLPWSFTPLDVPKGLTVEDQGVEADGAGGVCDDEKSEAFLSVKSFFSRSTSQAATVESSDMELPLPPPLRSPATWGECRHCEGWPFGLCRRAVVVPPPQSTPADSWMWRQKTGNVVKSCQPAVLADG